MQVKWTDYLSLRRSKAISRLAALAAHIHIIDAMLHCSASYWSAPGSPAMRARLVESRFHAGRGGEVGAASRRMATAATRPAAAQYSVSQNDCTA